MNDFRGASAVPVERVERNALLYSRLLAAVDRRLTDTGLSKPVRRILQEILARPGRSDAESAAQIGMARAQFSKVVNHLISTGAVVFEPSPHHLSQRLLSLSAEGGVVAADLSLRMAKAFDEVFEDLDPTDQRHVRRTILERQPHETPYGDITIEPVYPRDFPHLFFEVAVQGFDGMGHEGEGKADFISYVARIIDQQARLFGRAERGWQINSAGQRAGCCLLNLASLIHRAAA